MTAPDLTAAQVADHIDAAAALIERDGLHHGDFWAATTSGLAPRPAGAACCTAGALAVSVFGEPTTHALAADFCNADDDGWEHPVFTAAKRELGFYLPSGLFSWSDSHSQDEVVAGLRQAAANLRARGTLLTGEVSVAELADVAASAVAPPAQPTPTRIAIDADCPKCGYPERFFDLERRVFGCSSLNPTPCGYESMERTA